MSYFGSSVNIRLNLPLLCDIFHDSLILRNVTLASKGVLLGIWK